MIDDIFDDHTKTNILITAIYDNEKFKFVTRKFFEVWRIKYQKTKEDTENEFDNFVYNVIFTNIQSLEHDTGAKALRTAYGENIKRIKVRWINSTLKSLTQTKEALLKKELNSIKCDYLKKGTLPYEGMEQPEDIIKIREEELKEWKSSRYIPLCKYPYLLELSDSKINTTFKNDILVCVTDVLKDEYNFDMNNIILRSPSSIAPAMFETRKKGPRVNYAQLRKDGEIYKSKLYKSTSINNENLMTYSYHFSTNDDTQNKNVGSIKNLDGLKLELIQDSTKKRAITKLCLDNLDLELVRYIYSNIYILERDFTTSSLLEHLRLAPNSKNYDLVEAKVLKLPYYTIYTEVHDDDGNVIDQISFNLFGMARVFKKKNKRMCSIGRSYSPTIERIHTEIMYRNELKKLKSQEAVNLAYLLEGRRVFEIGKGNDIKNTPFKYYLSELESHIYLGNRKTVKEKMELVQQLFEEIKNNQFIIKKYELGPGVIYVYFYEDVEKRKEILNNTILSLPSYIKD